MTSKFSVWDADESKDYASWISIWEEWPEREVGAHPAYVSLFKAPGDRILCAAYRTVDNGSVLYPFILREVPPYLLPSKQAESLTDIITPYGYGGPQVWDVSDVSRSASEFWTLFDAWAKKNNIVSEFIRFGLFPNKQLPYPGDTVVRSRNIVRSLELDDDAMFLSFEKKVRKNVRKAVRSGLTVEIDEHGERLDEFLRIYSGTMVRRKASESYRFPSTFFETIHSRLPGHFAYAHVLHDGKIISTELLLISGFNVYSFLGGTDQGCFEFRPNDLLKHEVIRWARSKGKRKYVLGGGALPDDGIERYKRSFAPDGAVDFMTGQRILQPHTYQQLVQALCAKSSSEKQQLFIEESAYFPKYRTPL